jgi:hypothetical protein
MPDNLIRGPVLRCRFFSESAMSLGGQVKFLTCPYFRESLVQTTNPNNRRNPRPRIESSVSIAVQDLKVSDRLS